MSHKHSNENDTSITLAIVVDIYCFVFGVDNSYISRMVNLSTLAPDIVAAILDDTLPDHITLFELAV